MFGYLNDLQQHSYLQPERQAHNIAPAIMGRTGLYGSLLAKRQLKRGLRTGLHFNNHRHEIIKTKKRDGKPSLFSNIKIRNHSG